MATRVAMNVKTTAFAIFIFPCVRSIVSRQHSIFGDEEKLYTALPFLARSNPMPPRQPTACAELRKG
jgi:hypothetical protein